jgi:predicted helicase
MSLGDKKDKDAVVIFENYSSGVKTNRDAWCYNFSQSKLAQNMQSMIDFYNQEVSRYELACKDLTKDNYPNVDNFINTDTTQISWNRGLKNDFGRFVTHTYQDDALVTGLYRPFTKSPVYFSKYMNDMVYQMPRIFPDSSVKNLVILLKQRWSKQGDFALIVNCIPDLHMAAHNASPYTFTKPIPHPRKLTHKAASLTNQPHPQQQATHAAMPSQMQA